jgi:hypothetical protein
MEAKLHLYIEGKVEAKLDLPHPRPILLVGQGRVELRLDGAPDVEAELCLLLAPHALTRNVRRSIVGET